MTAAKLASFCMLALIGLARMGEVHAGYVDCTTCHIDPAPGSAAKDYIEFFIDHQRQHVVAIAYPAVSTNYRQPNAATENITFFDTNGNGIVDPEEVQLFGMSGTVECSSCHREHGKTAPPATPNMYLRIANANDALCLVCHDR